MHIVPVAAPIEAEKQHDRRGHRMSQSHHTARKRRWEPEKIAHNKLLLGHEPISHDPDESATFQAFSNLQHGVDVANLDNAVGNRGIELLDEFPNQWRVSFVHQHLDFDLLVGEPKRSQYLKAAEMRAEQQASTSISQCTVECVEPVDLDVEQVESTPEKIHAIQNG